MMLYFCQNFTQYCFERNFLADIPWWSGVQTKGTTIWSWEGGGGWGWQIWWGQIIYFHHGLGRKINSQVNWGQKINFNRKKTPKQTNNTKQKQKGAWGLVRGFSKERQDMALYVLQTTSTSSSVYRCLNILGSKRIVFEGGLAGPPPELLKAIFIQNGAILCNNVLGYYETTRG